MTTAETFDRDVTADAVSVARVRDSFSEWLRQFGLSPERHNDVVLAVNEALANTAEFAYVDRARPGRVAIAVRYDGSGSSVTVAVTDEGTWRAPEPVEMSEVPGLPTLRGRGIPLMRALADEVTIETAPTGTTVRLRFDRIDRGFTYRRKSVTLEV